MAITLAAGLTLAAIGPGLAAFVLVARLRARLWLSGILGATGWLVALLARLPILVYINTLGVLGPILLSSVAAGVFEESIRLLIVWYRALKGLRVREALSVGLGWGLGEALVTYVLRLPLALSLGVGLSLLLAGAVERNIAILFHATMAIMVFLSLATRKLHPLALAILLHTLVDMTASASYMLLRNYWLVEGLIAIVAMASLLPTLLLYRKLLEH